MAHKHADVGAWKGLLANANAGGENVHRGATLGAALGTATGVDALDPNPFPPAARAELAVEIDAFIAAVIAK